MDAALCLDALRLPRCPPNVKYVCALRALLPCADLRARSGSGPIPVRSVELRLEMEIS